MVEAKPKERERVATVHAHSHDYLPDEEPAAAEQQQVTPPPEVALAIDEVAAWTASEHAQEFLIPKTRRSLRQA